MISWGKSCLLEVVAVSGCTMNDFEMYHSVSLLHRVPDQHSDE